MVGVVSIVRNYDQTQKIEFVSDDGIVFEGDTIATGSGASCDIYWTDKSGIANHPRDFPDESTVCVGKPRMPSDHYPIVVVVK